MFYPPWYLSGVIAFITIFPCILMKIISLITSLKCTHTKNYSCDADQHLMALKYFAKWREREETFLFLPKNVNWN